MGLGESVGQAAGSEGAQSLPSLLRKDLLDYNRWTR